MFRIIIAALALIAILFSATEAHAKDQEFTFEDDYIEGELATANFMDVSTLGGGELFSLIRVRDSFDDKMYAEIDNL